MSREALDSQYVDYAVKFSDRHKLLKDSSILDNLNLEVYAVSFETYVYSLENQHLLVNLSQQCKQ